MTFKQFLEEQESKLKLNRIIDLDSGFYMPVEEVTDFLRQSNIETVKWVMEEVLDTFKVCGWSDEEDGWRDKMKGYNECVDDLISELNKSIEDHA